MYVSWDLWDRYIWNSAKIIQILRLRNNCRVVLQVVTKFINKVKVFRDRWVDDEFLARRVPLEVSEWRTSS